MDRLQKLTERLPSSIQQNIQHIPGLGRKTGAQASGTGTAQGQQSGQTGQPGQAGQYPPPEWSQAIPVATPAGHNGPPPSFPEPSYQTPALAYEPHGHGISEKPAQAYHDPYPTPGSAKTAAFLAPAVPVARPERWTPVVLKPIIVLPFVILLAVLAIAMEILYFYNKKSNGFYVDPNFAAISLVISFIPVLLTFGFVTFITKANDEILRLQPYINAAKGDAPAERTVLLDYINLSSFLLIPRAIGFKDYLVALSAAIVIAAGFFQPIVAAIFVVRSTRVMMPKTTTTSSAVIGLRTDFADLNNFVAAAGYAEAALIHGLGDPPFVCDGWSIAPFEFQWMLDQVAKNGTASVNTFATLTTPRCSLSDDITGGTGTSWTSTYNGWGTSCSASFSIEASNSGESNFGVVRVDNCALNGTIPGDSFKPIMFWFYGPGGQTSTTWCSPTVVAYNAVANMTLFNNTIGEVTLVDAITTPLNITDDYGLGLNGIFFPNTTNRFVAARATSIQSTIPGSIFRAAQEKANGNINDIFTDVSQLFEITNNFYTQYLATAGQTNFFIPTEYDTPAQIEAWQPRLWMNSLATHGFAALFLLISILLFLLHMIHRKQRNALFLAGPPGSIASAVSLTSSARFGALLNAGDNLVDLRDKLDGMKFGIDRDTWQIIVEKDDRVEDARYGNVGNGERGLDEKKSKHLSVPLSLRPGRESVVGTVLHPALASSPPPTPGFHFPTGPGSGAPPASPGNQNQKVDVVGTVATPNSATFMIPPQPSPNQHSPGFPVPPPPGFAPAPAH